MKSENSGLPGKSRQRRQIPLKLAHSHRLPRKRLFTQTLQWIRTLRLNTQSQISSENFDQSKALFLWSCLCPTSPFQSLTCIYHPFACNVTVQKMRFYFCDGHRFAAPWSTLGEIYSLLDRCRSSCSVPCVFASDVKYRTFIL